MAALLCGVIPLVWINAYVCTKQAAQPAMLALVPHASRQARPQGVSTKRLTQRAALVDTKTKCLKTRVLSGTPPRQSVVFFTPNGFASTGAMEQEHKTRKGNTARSAENEFSTFAPTNSLENGLMDFFKVSLRSKAMANHANSIRTSIQSPIPFNAGFLTVEQLYQAAFQNGRAPRSPEYKAGALMALEHRIERKDIEQPYRVGTSAADAYFAGMEEGKAIWRAAVAKIGGAA